MDTPASKPKRFLKMDEVCKRVGLSRSHINKMIELGEFPVGFHVSPRRIGFLESHIDRWIDTRKRWQGAKKATDDDG